MYEKYTLEDFKADFNPNLQHGPNDQGVWPNSKLVASVVCRLQFFWPISDFFCKCQKSILFNAKKYLHNKKWLNITIPPIRTKLQMFPHLNNSQKSDLWLEER